MSDMECPKCAGSGAIDQDAPMACDLCDGDGQVSNDSAGRYYQENIMYLYECDHARHLRVSVLECGLALKSAAQREREYRELLRLAGRMANAAEALLSGGLHRLTQDASHLSKALEAYDSAILQAPEGRSVDKLNGRDHPKLDAAGWGIFM